VDTGSGPWLLRALDVLGGCDEIVVVVGALADTVAGLLPDGVVAVTNHAHADGMGSSLRTGLDALADSDTQAALVMLVDLPDVTRAVADRLATAFRKSIVPAGILARAGYVGEPGHPVLIGQDHYAGVIQEAAGDAGARAYLTTHHVQVIECGDIGGGRDVDTQDQLQLP
jgi:CTP:molybdopterin cytidylyltransferase MocA